MHEGPELADLEKKFNFLHYSPPEIFPAPFTCQIDERLHSYPDDKLYDGSRYRS